MGKAVKNTFFSVKIMILIVSFTSFNEIFAESSPLKTDIAEYDLGYKDGLNEAELLDSEIYFFIGIASPFIANGYACFLFDIYTLFAKIQYPEKISIKSSKYQQGFKNAYSKQIRIKRLKSALQGNFIAGAGYAYLFLIIASLMSTFFFSFW
ncbi:MAG: hypothetical protein PHW02_01955 [bacterium]|nr:hypothetical protein [bacterium]